MVWGNNWYAAGNGLIRGEANISQKGRLTLQSEDRGLGAKNDAGHLAMRTSANGPQLLLIEGS